MTPPRPREVNVALIGGGFMGKAHSLAYAGMPMFFPEAVARPRRSLLIDVDREQAQRSAEAYGWDRSSTSWRDAVDDPGIDVIDIATPNHLHAEMAIAAAEAGKHILCEKPLAAAPADARRMWDAVRAAGVVHGVAFNYRRTPAVVLAKKLLDEGAIGEVRNFRSTYFQDWGADPAFPRTWRFQRAIAGSGALGDTGSHLIDLARYLVGEISGVNAVTARFVDARPDPSTGGALAAVDVDDHAMTLLRFQGGAIGSLEASRAAWGRNNHITFEIHGSEGSLYFDYERRDELQLALRSDAADRRGFRTIRSGPATPYGEFLWPVPAQGIGYAETMIIQCYEFMRAVTDGGVVEPNFSDGYQTTVVEHAILASADRAAWVEVPALGE